MKATWEKDGVRLYLGDCLDVLPHLEDSMDLVVTSPPYNCGMDYGICGDSLPVKDYFAWFESVFCHVARTVKPSGRMAVNVPSWIGSRSEQVFAFDEYRAILDRLMFFRDAIVWDKGPPNGAAWGNYPTSPRIRAGHEWILVYQLGTGSTGKSDISWEDWSRFTQSLWRVPATFPYGKEHPATFPEEAGLAQDWYEGLYPERSWHPPVFGYVFENNVHSYVKYPQDTPAGLEDVRVVFWFDN